jgi:hypothetical protein
VHGALRRLESWLSRVPRDRPWAVFGEQLHLMPPEEFIMLGDDLPLAADQDPPLAALDLHRSADESEGDRVPVGVQADEEVVGDDARVGRLQSEGRVVGDRDEVHALDGKPVDRALVGRPMEPLIRNRCHPYEELFPEMAVIDELATREEVVFDGP